MDLKHTRTRASVRGLEQHERVARRELGLAEVDLGKLGNEPLERQALAERHEVHLPRTGRRVLRGTNTPAALASR
jgi:hypothetical protein